MKPALPILFALGSLVALTGCPAQLGGTHGLLADPHLPQDVENDFGIDPPTATVADLAVAVGEVADLSVTPPPPPPNDLAGVTPPPAASMLVGLFEPEDFQNSSLTSKLSAHALAGKQAHANSVRTLFTVRNYTASIDVTGLVAMVKAFKAEGFHTTVTISGPTCTKNNPSNCANEPTSANDFTGYLNKWFTAMGPNISYVDALEIWNEWDGGYGYKVASGSGYNFYAYSATQYVEYFLQPAATILKSHPTIEFIAGAVVDGSGNNNLSQLVAQITKVGVARYPDAFGYHPYGTKWSDITNQLTTAEGIVKSTGKPLALTEWGCDPSWEGTCDMPTILGAAFDPKTGLGAYKISEADYYLLSLDTSSSAYTPYAPIRLLNCDSSNSPAAVYNTFQTNAARINP